MLNYCRHTPLGACLYLDCYVIWLLIDTRVVQPLVQDHCAYPTRVERLRTRPMYAYPYITCVTVYTSTEASQVEFDPGCEAMIYTVDGTPLQGIPALSIKDWTGLSI